MSLMFFLYLLAVVVLIEATTNIITKSDVFAPIREYCFARSEKNKFWSFMDALFDCAYCMSVWVSFFYVGMLFLYRQDKLPLFVLMLFAGMILHRLSNVLHFIIHRCDRGY